MTIAPKDLELAAAENSLGGAILETILGSVLVGRINTPLVGKPIATGIVTLPMAITTMAIDAHGQFLYWAVAR
jgi:hypothetical protein